MPGNHASQTTQESSKKSKKQPEKKIGPFAAGIGACVWINTIETENGPRTVRSITVNPRRYFDRETNEWKDAPSYNPADLPALIFALNQALEHCFTVPLKVEGQQSGDSPQHDGQLANEDVVF